VADDFEVTGVLGALNRERQGTWRLVCRLGGGRKTGAWLVEDRDGARAVLKRHPFVSTRRDLDRTAALVAQARAHGWPTPAWIAWGLDERRRPYVLAELVAGEHLDTLDDAALDALLAVLAVLDRQRGLAGRAGADWADDAWHAVFGDGSAWRAALRRQSPEALEAGEAIARRAAPFRDVQLPGADLVHTDFGLHNILFCNGEVTAVVDLEGLGRGPAAIDVATLLFSVRGRDAAPEPILARLAAYALDRDGAAVTTVCLASSLFDWCVFATSGWEPDAVTAYLLWAASLFDRLA
jgi:Ser/Thr protein kinase RdoA (MazF antagonist)